MNLKEKEFTAPACCVFATEEEIDGVPYFEPQFRDFHSFVANNIVQSFDLFPDALGWSDEIYMKKYGKEPDGPYVIQITKQELKEQLEQWTDEGYLNTLYKLRGTSPEIPVEVFCKQIIPLIKKRLRNIKGKVWVTNSGLAQEYRLFNPKEKP